MLSRLRRLESRRYTRVRVRVGAFCRSTHASTPGTLQRGIGWPIVASIWRTIIRSCQVAIVETIPSRSTRAVRPARWM